MQNHSTLKETNCSKGRKLWSSKKQHYHRGIRRLLEGSFMVRGINRAQDLSNAQKGF